MALASIVSDSKQSKVSAFLYSNFNTSKCSKYTTLREAFKNKGQKLDTGESGGERGRGGERSDGILNSEAEVINPIIFARIQVSNH
jgi:hypothetical protein